MVKFKEIIMNKKLLFYLFFFGGFCVHAKGQLAKGQSAEKNVQQYTPSVLLNKGQTEYKHFNNLYTQTQNFNKSGERINQFRRSTFFTSINQLTYGASSKLSVGAEFWLKSVNIGDENSSPTRVFTLGNGTDARTAITNVGVKLKFSPVKKLPKLSVESTLLISSAKDPEGINNGRPFLDSERHLWISKAFYDKSIGTKFQLFTQLTTWVSIDKNFTNKNMGIAIPLAAFFSYFPTKKWTIYLQNEIWPNIGTDLISSYFLQEGIGVKHQLFSGVEVEMLYTNFVIGKNSGAGQTFNIGVRILN